VFKHKALYDKLGTMLAGQPHLLKELDGFYVAGRIPLDK
jgi:hypothetical protein